MANTNKNGLETIYFIQVFLQDEKGDTVFCFLGTDTVDDDKESSDSRLGQLRLYSFDDSLKDDLKNKDTTIAFFSKAVFFTDKTVAEEIVDQHIKSIPHNAQKKPPVVARIKRYDDMPLQVMERIGLSNRFIKQTIHVGDHNIGYRLTIR